MSQDAVDILPHRHAHAFVRPPDEGGERRLVNIAAFIIVASVIGSVIVSRLVERRLLFSRAGLIGVAAELVILAFLRRRRVAQTLTEFFAATTHPLNLAIFRMVVFWAIFHEVQLSEIGSFSRMPSGLQFAPWGMAWLLPHLPIHVRLVAIASRLLLVFSVAGFLGLFSRTSALACTLLGFYCFGIPQFYGKVDHNHHLLWFAIILAVSPCGDFFALDASLSAWKRADCEITDPPSPSRAYALPLRFVMLLMGVIYFFPGFWKLWQGGFDWFLTDNLPRQLHLFWTWSFDGLWLPAFRIDQHVVLYRIAAAATPLFELSFVFFMFHRTLRAVSAVGGLIFHASTNWFMRISFLSLRVCYVALIDWAWIFGCIGRAVHREVFFVYDGTSLSCRRLVTLIKVWDIFQRVTYINGADKEALSSPLLHLPDRDKGSLAQKTFVVTHNRVWSGSSAYRVLAWRVPALWPLVPILHFWKPSNLAPAVYKRPREPRLLAHASAQIAGRRSTQLACIAAVGSLLLFGSVLGGVTRHINGWPFACYPPFSLPVPDQIPSLSVVAVAPSGSETVVKNFGFPYHRYYGLSMNILAIENPLVRNDRLLLVWARAIKLAPELRATTTVKFYIENLWIDPALWSRNPKNRKLLFVWHPPADGGIPPHLNTHVSYTEWQ